MIRPKIVLASLAALPFFALAAAGSGSAQPADGAHPDPRAPVSLTAEERLHIVESMRIFLEGSQVIMEAGSEGDLDRLRDAADDMARPRRDAMGPRVQAKLPAGFREMGRLLRQDLAAIAALPDDTPVAEAQGAAAAAMYTCLACHDSYRIETVPD